MGSTDGDSLWRNGQLSMLDELQQTIRDVQRHMPFHVQGAPVFMHVLKASPPSDGYEIYLVNRGLINPQAEVFAAISLGPSLVSQKTVWIVKDRIFGKTLGRL